MENEENDFEKQTEDVHMHKHHLWQADFEKLAELNVVQENLTKYVNADGELGVGLLDGKFFCKPRQMEKVRKDQVKNNAGGYVFKVSDETIVRRFLILGSTRSSFEQNSKKLTMEDAKGMVEIIEKGNAAMILKELNEINKANRNPKMTSMLFTLALCARYQVHNSVKNKEDELLKFYSTYIRQMHNVAFSLVPSVCRIPTHLFEFIRYCELVAKSSQFTEENKSSTGWGQLMRRTIGEWYLRKNANQLAMLLTKYPQREGWSHRDVLRLAHPKLQKEEKFEERIDRLEMEQVFRYAIKGDLLPRRHELKDEKNEESGFGNKTLVPYTEEQIRREKKSRALNLIKAVLLVKKETRENIIAAAITEFGLVREHLPTECLNSKIIWETLFDIQMPMTAMIRNLGKMSLVGCLDQNRTNTIVERLTNAVELEKARIHPLALLTARAVYSQGRGDKGSLFWKPDKRICDALEVGFYKSFANAPSTGKRYCLALDVSGSMGDNVANSPLSCRDGASALSLITFHNEPKVQLVAFCDKLKSIHITKDWSIEQLNKRIKKLRFGATDCALPMIWAMEKNLEFDVFIIYTDNETWFGKIHPFEAIQMYRKKMGIPDAKVIVMGMQGSEFTIADPTDRGMLDVAGFDAAIPQIIHEFVMGNI